MSVAVPGVFADDQQWELVRQALGDEGYEEFYEWLVNETTTGGIKRFFVYTRQAGQEVYSVPVGDSGLDLIVAYKPNPDHPLTWSWIIERVIKHEDNKLANLSPGEAVILRTVGPWVRS
jgi:hypothetical protein